MPGAVGNSNGIGMSPGISSEMGMAANREISAQNLQRGIKNDRSIASMREALLKYARRLLKEDKLRVLAQQGYQVYAGMDDDELNDKFVECLIVNLPQKEVDQLIQQSARFDTALKNDMGSAQSNLQRTIEASKRAAREAEAQQKMAVKVTMQGSGAKSKSIQTQEKSRTKVLQKQAKVSRFQARGFKDLRKELLYILCKVYMKGDVYRLAIEMGVELQGGENAKSVMHTVIDRVIAYVSVMLGKSPNYLGSAISNVAPYRELLKMTSYAYVTGEPGVSIAEIQQRQKDALAAKMQQKVMSRRRKGSIGARRAVGKKFLGSPMGKKLSGMLEGMTTAELMDTATKLGISVLGRNVDRYKLGKQIMDVMADRYTRQKKLEEKQAKLKAVGKANAGIDEELKALKATNPFIKQAVVGNNELTPVQFNKKGEVVSKSILAAMPVYVIGYGRAGQFEEEKEEKKSEDDVAVGIGKKFKGFWRNLGASIANPFTRKKRIKSQIADDLSGPEEPHAVDMSVSGVGSSPGSTPGSMRDVLEFEDWMKADAERLKILKKAGKGNINKGLDVVLSHPQEYKDVHEAYVAYCDAEIDAASSGKLGPRRAGTINGFDFADGVLTRLDTIIKLMGGGAGSGGLPSAATFSGSMTTTLGGDATKAVFSDVHTATDIVSAGASRLKEVRLKSSCATLSVDELKGKIMQGENIFAEKDDAGAVKRPLPMSLINLAKSQGMTATSASRHYASGKRGTAQALGDIASSVDDIVEAVQSTSSFLNGTLPLLLSSFVLAAPMGVGAMTNPAALAMLGINSAGAAIDTAMETTISAVTGSLLPMPAHAKGGTGKYKGPVRSGGTQFISGDSLNGKENRELVNIDWDNRTYHVKPIPKFATGGGGNIGNTKVTGITSSERMAPMSVGISGPIAGYSSIPDGITDMGEQVAVKVINVTPGIYDKHPVYGMSAMDVLMAMSTALGSIGTLMASDLDLQKMQTAYLQVISNKAGSSDSSPGNTLGHGFTSALDSILTGS